MLRLFAIGFIALSLVHCGYPGKNLNTLEKQAEIEWVFGTFERNYAPAEWKTVKHGASLAQIKADCIEKSQSISKGDEFIGLLNTCVNRFQDAHTRIIPGGQALPEMITVAYLGFQTAFVRFNKTPPSETPTIPEAAAMEYGLQVSTLLPTTKDPNFPVAKGDIITQINDQPVKDYLTQNLVPSANLGNELSSLTVAGNKFAVRDSTGGLLPAEDSIHLEFLRGGLVRTATLPWNRKDLVAFTSEQTKADNEKKEKEKSKEKTQESTPPTMQSLESGFWVGSELIDKALDIFSKYRMSGGSRVALLLSESFHFYSYSPVQGFLAKLNFDSEAKPEEKKEDLFDKIIGKSKFDISVAPFTARIFFDENENRLGYIRIESFGLGDTEVKTFKALLTRMNQMKVKGVVLDLLNNGGGSLVHGLAMANALTEKPLAMPKLQVALNDHWINGFKSDSLYAPSDAQRTFAGRVFRQLQDDISNNLRISRPISAVELAPFVLEIDKQNCVKDETCLKSGTKLVLLVNEMCASMCDIFAGVFRDNQLGTIVGSQTMGAGGNVVMHGFSPVTQIALSQTESLIVDSNGNYLENQGIVPQELIDTPYDKLNGYSLTYKKAIELMK